MSTIGLPFPPLALRRLVSPIVDDSYYDNPTGDYILGPLDIGPLAPGQVYERVLDFGCGCGRAARRLLLQRNRPKLYIGLDIHRPMIQWCQQNLSQDGFNFVHHDVWSPGYGVDNSKNRYLPLTPLGSGFTLIHVGSMFTKLHEDQAAFYLREMASMLAPTGIIYATWFFFNKQWFPMMAENQNTIFVNEHDTTQAVYYDWSYFRNLAKSLGLRITEVQWTKALGLQNVVILAKSDQFPELGDRIQPPSSVIGFSRFGSPISFPQYRYDLTNVPAAASDVRIQQMVTDLRAVQAELERLLAEQSSHTQHIASLTAQRDHWAQQHAAMRSSSEEAIRVLSTRIEEGAARLQTAENRIREEKLAVTAAHAERQQLAEKLVAQQEQHGETVRELQKTNATHEETLRELQKTNATLSQIWNSHGWKALSLYYRLCRRLVKIRMVRTVRDGVALLRDIRLVSASGLFDKDWYLQRNPDVAQAGVSPLRHYLRRGAFEGRDPNPLFDSDWYLTQYPDLSKTGVNPLVHYLCHGAKEGRDPSPHFDSDWYLEQYADVVKAGMNPLAHYMRHGAAEGRIPTSDLDHNHHTLQPDGGSGLQSRSFPAARPIVPPNRNDGGSLVGLAGKKRPKLKVRPIASVQPKRSTKNAGKRRLICITHVLPYPPRAGNEYRIHRMLDWLETTGFEVFLVVCPLPNHSIPSQRLEDACSFYSNVLLCQRDGTVLYHLVEGDVPLKELAGVKPRDFGALLGEDTGDTAIPQRLLPIVRTFCPDFLVELLLHLDRVLRPDVLLLEYVFMTRALPLMRPESVKIVDTIDVFSSKHDKVVHYGIEDGLALTTEEEASLLARADVVVAIQAEEAEALRRIVTKKPVITVGIDFCPVEPPSVPASSPVVLMVASDNVLNVKGLKDFLRFAWPLVRREVPDAKLRVIGTIGLQVGVEDSSVEILGLVDDLKAAYAEARVVINPAVAGTGLKTKTIEALCHLTPLVTWPSGVDGVEKDIQELCYIATDWFMFAQYVIDLCKSDDASQTLVSKRNEILQRFSPDTIYTELKAALSDVHVGAN